MKMPIEKGEVRAIFPKSPCPTVQIPRLTTTARTASDVPQLHSSIDG
jgi:hypothetical protein